MGLSIILLLLSLLLGFTHLKRFRETTDKQGLIRASLAVLLTPFLIPAFTLPVVLFSTTAHFRDVFWSWIRRERERPGLASGLFAALTCPIIVLIGGTVTLIVLLKWLGFLIMLAVIGVLVGVYFTVRYWLRH